MSSQHQYLVCSQRPGSPRVALEVCRLCPKARGCQAWREYRQPALLVLPLPPARSAVLARGLVGRPAPRAQASPQAGLPFTS